MKVHWTVSLAACAAVLLGGVLLANAAPNAGQSQTAVQGSAGVVRISALMGATVVDPQGQKKVGQIKDVLLDPQTGQASFVVLDTEVPGSGHAMLVVPYQALRVSCNPADSRQSVVLDLRAERLRAAPQIQNGQWQVLQNPQFLEQARNFYRSGTYTAMRPIDTPPSLPAQPVPQPSVNYANPGHGLPQDLVDFYNE